LSKLDAEIHHVPGIENQVSDVLSRQHKDIEDILQETKYRNVLSEREAEHLLSRLSIPAGRVFTPTEVRHLLNLPSLPAPNRLNPKRSHRRNFSIQNMKNTHTTLAEKNTYLDALSDAQE
jgi:hypothetical protein